MPNYSATTAHQFLQLGDRQIGVYNLHDTRKTAELVNPLVEELRRHGQLDFYLNQVEPLQYAVLAMQRRGLLLDKDARSGYARRIRGELESCDAYLRNERGHPEFNPNSGPQLAAWLFNSRAEGGLGLKPGRKTPSGGRYSTDQAALMSVLRVLRKRDELARPILMKLFHRSRLRTIRDRYLRFEVGPDGRVRPRVKMYRAETFRFAYSDPALHQWPPECRHFFAARDGCSLVSLDKAQLEARILAHQSGDQPTIQAFHDDLDVHRENAADLFGIEPADVTPAQRLYGKTFFYRKTYGGSAATGDKKLFCPCPECEDKSPQLLKISKRDQVDAEVRWAKAHPAVDKFHQGNVKFVRKHHYYRSPFGALRWISAPWSSELDRELRNIPMQMGGALHMNRLQVRLHAMGAPIILQHHDSFLFEVPDNQLKRLIPKWVYEMEQPEPALGGVILPVDVKVGRNWGNHDPASNQQGLRTWPR